MSSQTLTEVLRSLNFKPVDVAMAKLLPLRKLSRILKLPSYSSCSFRKFPHLLEASSPLIHIFNNVHQFHPPSFLRSFCSRPLDIVGDDSRGPATIDYR